MDNTMISLGILNFLFHPVDEVTNFYYLPKHRVKPNPGCYLTDSGC